MHLRPELVDYIKKSRTFGMSDFEIRSNLIQAGWDDFDIDPAFESLRKPPVKNIRSLVKRKNILPSLKVSTALVVSLTIAVLALGGFVGILLKDRVDLSKTNERAVQDFYTRLAVGSIGFTDAGELVFPDDQRFLDSKDKLIQEKKDFVEVDLRNMVLNIYEEGNFLKEFTIKSKGKEGSWWETPTGMYSVIGKEKNHFSSIGEVWMPWSIQFYGNFFIHGWPYYEDGSTVTEGYSGGCVRLSSEDAKEVYSFVEKGTPIIVREDIVDEDFGNVIVKESKVPQINAKSFLVANLATGETFLEKRTDDVLPVDSLTKLMTATIASELIYLERSILVKDNSLAAVLTSFAPEPGDSYIAFDLLYPLLMQSSNEAATLISSFIGKDNFVHAMNKKTSSLSMLSTTYVDSSGISNGNVSSSNDVFKLLQYLYFKRHFLLDITKGVPYNTYSGLHSSDLDNFNEFVNDPRLVGMKNGESKAGLQTLASVWEFDTPTGIVPIAIVVLGSSDRVSDTERLVNWVQNNLDTE